MARLYSQHLCTLLQPFPTEVLEQPFGDDGDTWVIRCMDHYMPVGVSCSFSVNMDDGSRIWSVSYAASDGEWEHWEGRQVVIAPWSLFYGVDGLTAWTGQGPSLRVSGYLLTP